MRFSLLYQFQAGLLGTLIGETLSFEAKKPLSVKTPLSNILGQVTEQWLERGSFTVSDWYYLYQNLRANGQNVEDSDLALIVSIPLILRFHDDFNLFREQIQLIRDGWQLPLETFEDILIWGYTIALILRSKVEPQQLLGQLLKIKSTTATPLLEDLKQVQTLLDQQVPLFQGIRQLDRQPSSTIAIAITLYIFNSTPEDFRLCLLRASRVPHQSRIIMFLVGMLAGVYNSIRGMPISWRVASQKDPLGQKLYQFAIELFSTWSGVYTANNAQFQEIAIASPGIIQPRTNLKIISQQDFLL